ncbi:MAG: HAD hydrolase family protein [Phycisphaerales bacterium]|nr:HAD hydrolase family protein [Phycisphaerales bacterium]
MLDQIRRVLAARPFAPFTITLASGGSRRVLAAEHLAIAPGGEAIHIAAERSCEAIAVSGISGIRSDSGDSAAGPGVASRLAGIRLLVFDFDGVWSNNQVLVMQDGTEGVLCNRSDGLGLGMLKEAGVPMLVLSKEQNPVVAARCRKVGVECLQGIDDKLKELERIASHRGLTLHEITYVGNDINDVPCMRAVGIAIAVADAYPEALAAAALITTRAGGYGAVREVCEWFLGARAAHAGRVG